MLENALGIIVGGVGKEKNIYIDIHLRLVLGGVRRSLKGSVAVPSQSVKKQGLICQQSDSDWTVRCSFVHVHVLVPGRKKGRKRDETVGRFRMNDKTCKCGTLTEMIYFAALLFFLWAVFDYQIVCHAEQQKNFV